MRQGVVTTLTFLGTRTRTTSKKSVTWEEQLDILSHCVFGRELMPARLSLRFSTGWERFSQNDRVQRDIT